MRLVDTIRNTKPPAMRRAEGWMIECLNHEIYEYSWIRWNFSLVSTSHQKSVQAIAPVDLLYFTKSSSFSWSTPFIFRTSLPISHKYNVLYFPHLKGSYRNSIWLPDKLWPSADSGAGSILERNIIIHWTSLSSPITLFIFFRCIFNKYINGINLRKFSYKKDAKISLYNKK